MDADAGRRYHARFLENLPADAFVHGHGAAEGTRTRVADAEQVERRLQLSIFPLAAVQAKEGDVRHAAQFNYVGAKKAVSVTRAGGLDRLEVGFLRAASRPYPGRVNTSSNLSLS